MISDKFTKHFLVKKRFSDFQTLYVDGTLNEHFLIFGVRRENFVMGLKIDFSFEILEIVVQIANGLVAPFFIMCEEFIKDFPYK